MVNTGYKIWQYRLKEISIDGGLTWYEDTTSIESNTDINGNPVYIGQGTYVPPIWDPLSCPLPPTTTTTTTVAPTTTTTSSTTTTTTLSPTTTTTTAAPGTTTTSTTTTTTTEAWNSINVYYSSTELGACYAGTEVTLYWQGGGSFGSDEVYYTDLGITLATGYYMLTGVYYHIVSGNLMNIGGTSCPATTTSTTTTTAAPSGYKTLSLLLSSTNGGACGAAAQTEYVVGSYVIGTSLTGYTIYIDSALTTPRTSYSYFYDNTSGGSYQTYHISTSTGVVGTLASTQC